MFLPQAAQVMMIMMFYNAHIWIFSGFYAADIIKAFIFIHYKNILVLSLICHFYSLEVFAWCQLRRFPMPANMHYCHFQYWCVCVCVCIIVMFGCCCFVFTFFVFNTMFTYSYLAMNGANTVKLVSNIHFH